MARLKGISVNLNAFLDMLGVSEGTSTSKLTKDEGYDVIVTGTDETGRSTPEIFTDYSQHPFVNRKPKRINSKGLYSSASGKYQHMRVHWEHYRDQLKLPDFGPESQDLWAIQLIRERKALPLIEAGKFNEAVKAVSNLWASLPGAGYDQPEHSIEKLLNVYLDKGGKLWKSSTLSLPQSLPPLEPSNTVQLKPSPKPTPITESPITTPKPQGFWTLIAKLLKRN
jgi:muramidase (phage lysozyme)